MPWKPALNYFVGTVMRQHLRCGSSLTLDLMGPEELTACANKCSGDTSDIRNQAKQIKKILRGVKYTVRRRNVTCQELRYSLSILEKGGNASEAEIRKIDPRLVVNYVLCCYLTNKLHLIKERAMALVWVICYME